MTSKLAKKYLLGLSLVELMVALVISSILMAGVIYIFNSSKRTYTLQTELAELQDNARFITDELTREVRMAGYFGCSGTPPQNTAITFRAFQTTHSNGGPVDDVLIGAGFPRSDTLRITSFTQQLSVDLNTQFTSGGTTINLLPGSFLPQTGEQIIVSNCRYSHLYDVTAPEPTNANLLVKINPGFFLLGYLPPVEVFMIAQPISYRVLRTPQGGFALYRCKDDSKCMEDGELLVDGVQSMQVRYGIDTDTDNIPNRYTTLPTATGVSSVRITLLMRTTTKKGIECPVRKAFFLDQDTNSKRNDGTYFPMEDNPEGETGYCHRLITTTIDVRNSSII